MPLSGTAIINGLSGFQAPTALPGSKSQLFWKDPRGWVQDCKKDEALSCCRLYLDDVDVSNRLVLELKFEFAYPGCELCPESNSFISRNIGTYQVSHSAYHGEYPLGRTVSIITDFSFVSSLATPWVVLSHICLTRSDSI